MSSFSPWYKSALSLTVDGAKIKFRVPHDVFSTLRIDEGTVLLLDHLPASRPNKILDMGCGYGALGLPVAAKNPQASVEMVDRDLLAVEWARINAAEGGFLNAKAHSSLGYRDVLARDFDWILCNVPARIGTPFIEELFGAGLSMLAVGGEIRVVVIRDLGPVVESIAQKRDWKIEEVARGPRHIVYRFLGDAARSNETQSSGPISSHFSAAAVSGIEDQVLYARDQVLIGDKVTLERPFDISGDSAKLVSAVPMLLESFPRSAPKKVFNFRSGYGAVGLYARALWPEAQITAFDRDLLATSFMRANAKRLGFDSAVEVRECLDVSSALNDNERFDLAIGELSPAAGELVAEADLVSLAGHLESGGQALILTLEKTDRDWVRAIAKKRGLSVSRLITRDSNVVLRLTP